MKMILTRSLALLAFCFATTLLSAQTKAEFELKSMSLGPYDAMTVTVAGADEKLAEKTWRDLMKQYGGKCKRSKPEKFKTEAIFIDGNRVWSNPMCSVYSRRPRRRGKEPWQSRERPQPTRKSTQGLPR